MPGAVPRDPYASVALCLIKGKIYNTYVWHLIRDSICKMLSSEVINVKRITVKWIIFHTTFLTSSDKYGLQCATQICNFSSR
jgi:hypothetical protein